jgi:hypothetical protein
VELRLAAASKPAGVEVSTEHEFLTVELVEQLLRLACTPGSKAALQGGVCRSEAKRSD